MVYELIHAIPAQIHLLIVLVFGAGLLIWAFGHRLLRPMMVLGGAVAGSGIGLVASGYLPESIDFWIPIVAGAAVFGLIAIAAYRMVMAWSLALVLAVVCPLGYYTYTELSGQFDGQPGEPLEDAELVLNLGEDAKESGEESEGFDLEDLRKSTEKAKELLADILDPDEENAEDSDGDDEPLIPDTWRLKMRETIATLGDTVSTHWKDAPSSQKLGVVIAGLAGLLGGLAAGILVPSASSAIVTSFAGALMMLTSGMWLATRFDVPIDMIRPESATGSLTWWLSLSVVGLIFQFVLSGKKSKSKSSSSSSKSQSTESSD